MYIFKQIPQMVIVGIGYPTTDLGDLFALRMRDYTPTVDVAFVDGFAENMGLPLTRLPRSSGGANHFLTFLRSELFQLIEANYQGDPRRRILSGWSFGGLFGLYTLFRHPETFSDYLILSPSIWWDEKVILREEEAFLSGKKACP
jgi:predicted alpha/beta superfamily hydrolase